MPSIKAIMMAKPVPAFEHCGVNVLGLLCDSRAFFKLDDLWESDGSPEGREPNRYLQSGTGRAYLAEVARRYKVVEPELYFERFDGVWAHQDLAIDYAGWLSPGFRFAVAQLAKHAVQTILGRPAIERDAEWVELRAESKEARMDFTRTVEHQIEGPPGARKGLKHALMTDAVYRGGWGHGARELKRLRGLKPTANLRDHMTKNDLAVVRLVETIGASQLQDRQIKNLDRGMKCVERVSEKIAHAVHEIKRSAM